MKTPLTLGLSVLLSPMLLAEDRLLDDGPPGFLHFQRTDEKDAQKAQDFYVRTGAVDVVSITPLEINGEALFQVLIRTSTMRHTGNGQNEPIIFYSNFAKKENAENLMRKITLLVNEAK